MLAWLEATALATWTRESPSIWAYPLVLTLHTVGLGIVVGASAVIDLRFLGVARRISIPSLAPLFRIILWAFVLNTVTGVLLFIADATHKAGQTVFYIKLGLIALALWNTILARHVVLGAPQNDAAPSSRHSRLAVISLLLWFGAITAGRLMAYL